MGEDKDGTFMGIENAKIPFDMIPRLRTCPFEV